MADSVTKRPASFFDSFEAVIEENLQDAWHLREHIVGPLFAANIGLVSPLIRNLAASSPLLAACSPECPLGPKWLAAFDDAISNVWKPQLGRTKKEQKTLLESRIARGLPTTLDKFDIPLGEITSDKVQMAMQLIASKPDAFRTRLQRNTRMGWNGPLGCGLLFNNPWGGSIVERILDIIFIDRVKRVQGSHCAMSGFIFRFPKSYHPDCSSPGVPDSVWVSHMTKVTEDVKNILAVSSPLHIVTLLMYVNTYMNFTDHGKNTKRLALIPPIPGLIEELNTRKKEMWRWMNLGILVNQK